MTTEGIPYGDAVTDDRGYGIECPVCHEICRADPGASSEDRITKTAGIAYGIHYAERHQVGSSEPITLAEFRGATIDGIGCVYSIDADDRYERFDVYVSSGPVSNRPVGLNFDSFRDAVLWVVDQIDADIREQSPDPDR